MCESAAVAGSMAGHDELAEGIGPAPAARIWGGAPAVEGPACWYGAGQCPGAPVQ